MTNKLSLFPPALEVRAAYYGLFGRVHFPKMRLGEVIQGKEDFIIF